MRLATIQTPAGPGPAVIAGRFAVDVHATEPSLPSTLRGLLAAGSAAMQRVAHIARREASVRYPLDATEFLTPIPDPDKVICVGLNYRDHAEESGAKIPSEPVLFSKFASALLGPGRSIVLPPVSKKVDYEAELVVVVGKKGRFVPKDQAMQYVAGYCVGHDVSARDWQLEKDGKQWLAGKTFDTFAPVGPYLVTADEVADPHDLRIRLRLNGETMQDSNTKQMIFRIDELIAYVSQVVTLQPGDLIFTGTPPGVGAARKPEVWLKDGDVVEVEIDGLGILGNDVKQG